FDLEASRDLLLLYGIASEALASSAERENFCGTFPSTMRAPLVPAAASETEPVPLAALDGVNWPASLAAEGAAPDIHLSELPPDALLEDLDFSLSLSPAPAPAPAPERTG